MFQAARRCLQTTMIASSSRTIKRSVASPASASKALKGIMEVVESAVAKDTKASGVEGQPQRERAQLPSKTKKSRDDYKAFVAHKYIRPIDMSKEFMQKRPRPRLPREGPGRKDALLSDPFLRFGIDPRHECENGTLLRDYVSEMGKILPRAQTGLSQRSQRLMGKAIKRAKLMGIIPTFSRRRVNADYYT